MTKEEEKKDNPFEELRKKIDAVKKESGIKDPKKQTKAVAKKKKMLRDAGLDLLDGFIDFDK